MCDSPKISVIVAVYKAEKYIRKCLDSILKQSFGDFELLLVDDGSPDYSGKICDEYAARDSRVKVFHKENGGVSSTRQFGIEHACGEYTIHVDPDDWVEGTMLEDLYNAAVSSEADMVICDFYVDRNDQMTYVNQCPTSLNHLEVLKELFIRLHGSCCNKLIKTACIKCCDAHFPVSMNFCEDQYFIATLLVHNMKIFYLNKAYYHYVQYLNSNSLVNKRDVNLDLQLLALYKDILPNYIYNDYAKISVVYNMARSLFLREDITSDEYFRKVYQYRNCILKRKNIPFIFKILLFFSCFKLKRVCLNIYNLLQYKRK